MQPARSTARLASLAALLLAFMCAGPAGVRVAAAEQGAGPSAAESGTPIIPPGLEDVGVVEHLDGKVPLDVQFKDQDGKAVRFGDFFDGKKPVVLTLAYHTCPTVCSLVLSQTVETLKKVNWTVGKEYRAITLSFDPHETLEKTAAKRNQILAQYGRPEAAAPGAWPFLFGDDTSIHRITDAVGFKYHYVATDRQYAHPTVILLLKPNGEVARYLYGLDYNPNDVRLGLLEASNGRSISTVERVLLYCYHYDPQGGRYVLVATRVMQLGGALTALAFGSFLAVMWMRERRRSRAAAGGSSPDAPQPPKTPDPDTHPNRQAV